MAVGQVRREVERAQHGQHAAGVEGGAWSDGEVDTLLVTVDELPDGVDAADWTIDVSFPNGGAAALHQEGSVAISDEPETLEISYPAAGSWGEMEDGEYLALVTMAATAGEELCGEASWSRYYAADALADLLTAAAPAEPWTAARAQRWWNVHGVASAPPPGAAPAPER